MPVERIITTFPKANRFFMEKGIMCMVCGEPFWGTIGELLTQKGITADDKDMLLSECNDYLSNDEYMKNS
jgi:hypothetical protein